MRAKYFYGYNIVAAGFVIQAVCYGMLFTYGIFFKEFQAEFGWSRATISGAPSLCFLMGGAIGILAGRLNDKIGPRVLMVAASISFGLGYLLMSRMQAPWQLYVLYGVLVGVPFGVYDIVTLSTLARWFVRSRGIMSGIVKVGTGSGQFVIPLIATALIAAYGWRNSYLIFGAVFLVTLVAIALVLRRDPQGMGLLPDDAIDEPCGAGTGSPDPDVPLRAAVLTRQFWAICLAEFASFFCMLTIIVHIVPHAMDLGLPSATAAGVLATIAGVSMLGRIVMGTVNDRIGGKRSLMICFILLLCGLIWVQVAGEAWMLFLFAVIYGFAHGGFFTVVSPTVAELFGTGSHGVLYGIVLCHGNTGAAVGPLLAGRTFDVTGSYQIVFLVLTGVAGLGFVLIMLLRPLRGGGAGR
ncbi:MAG: MFS transporter [Deltaproteobacteria bacterium]|nr:MAG: MFS transporter [Deltaproteobacteria bacterium]